MTLQQEIIKDIQGIECEMGTPTFLWQSGTYNFVPSTTDFKRELDRGGFGVYRLLTATVRKYEWTENEMMEVELLPLFNNGYPTSGQIINYSLDGLNYRIESVKHDAVNATFRLTCHSTTALK